MNVRVRGIYATALTDVLGETGRVVQASPPIRERFDDAFPAAPADATVETTGDRQGVGVAGDPGAVSSVVDRLRAVGVDALSWADPTPRGAVYDAVVDETLGSGALVDLGERRAFLPYGNVEARVETGDAVRVQIREPKPPWSDDRPVADETVEVGGGLGTLVRGGASNPGGTDVDMADVLPTDVPDGWRAVWHRPADDADLDALDAALSAMAERAGALDDALADPLDHDAAPRQVWDGEAGAWAWFGRESRFALDERRGRTVPTMPGHHRIKAADERASAAVDFAEAVCEPASDGAFPFEVVSRQFGPREGDALAIGHGKPDGRLIVLGRGEVTDVDPEGTVTVRREMTPGG
ncbi:RNA-binding protein, partial [Halobacteriales archaeon QS_1_68_17]